MSHLILVELDSDLAKRLVNDPTDWNYKDKVELLQAIAYSLDTDDAEDE